MRKVVIASDSFKGSLSSSEVAEAACAGIYDVYPDCNVIKVNMADGGEGMLAAMNGNIRYETVTMTVHDPLGRPVEAKYLIADDRGHKTAVIEMAQASGLTLLSEDERNPLATSSFGTGELIIDAFVKGCRKFLIGIGGSATNDGGCGMLEALGITFINSEGERLIRCTGETLIRISSVDMSGVAPELTSSEFIVGCDVDALFTGRNGATHVFAPQKGADEKMIAELERGMVSFEGIVEDATGVRLSSVKGSGAAGGAGGALHAFMGAELKSGAEIILDLIGFDSIITDADLVITGEGKLDRQTFMGKGPSIVAARTKRQRIPAIAIAGTIDPELSDAEKSAFVAVLPVSKDISTPEEKALAMNPTIAKMNIRNMISRYLRQNL